MSVDQLPPGRAPAAQRGTQFVRYDEYIDKQIDATRRMVKTVDVMTALLTMATGTLGFLLVAAIVEHWLVPGGFNLAVRLALFFVLCTGLLFFTTRRLWPLVAGSINPAYAAQAIEHDNPSLKNSLLNLLLFRQHRDDVTDAVYETLEEQAARRLTRVPVDSAVDRSQLLRLGYVLIAIVAAVALYKILSPKDPFVTAGRVLMPWARIVPASRVSIENVEPGAVTLARGEVLTVSADVRGIGDDDPVVIRYTTADGQAVDRPAPMVPTSVGLRFTGQIPPASEGGKAGVAQNLRYRIEAGDARSLEYAVTVVSAPMITIERIDYDYPAYTRFTDRSVERLGDIRAIEGTRVTIHARANGPIEEAAIDFEADGRRDVRLEATGSEARATFPLALRDDRRTPQFTSYVLRFTGTDGRPNRDPVKFLIDVAPDVAPEVSITAPAEKVRDVRLDETVAIEVDSIDSDFALSEVRLHGESAGRPVVNEKLLAQEHTGRYRGRHLFTPNEHDLKLGDVVRYWVIARDNRTPEANETTSDSQTLRIVGADPRKPGKRPQDRNAQQEKREPQDQKEGEQQQGEGGQSDGAGSDSSQGEQGEQGEQQGESAQGESASADGSSDQPGEQNSTDQSGESQAGENESGDNKANENNSGDESNDQSGESNSGSQSGGKGEPTAGEQGESGESQEQQQPGGNSESGTSSKPSQQDSSPQPNGNNSSGKQDSNKPTAGEPGSDNQSDRQSGNNSGNPRDGKSPQDTQRQPGAGGQPKSGSEPSDTDSSPVSPEGDNDGEAFERIQDFLKREGQLPNEKDQQQGKPEQGDSAPGESASADGQNAPPSDSANPNQNGDTNAEKNNETPSDSKQDPNSKPEPGSDPNGTPDTNSRPGESPQESGESAEQAPSDEPQESNSPDGQHTSSEGESGAGDQPKENQGSPESQPNSQPGDKWQQKPSGDQQGNEQGEKQEPSSGGQGKRQNDSQGDTGGDRSGGGEEGAGQKSERDGTGSAGQNQSADEGAGESSEQGAGNNSPDAGQDAKSNDPTGQSGSKEKGDGSAQREGQGEQPGGSDQKPGGEQAGENNPQQTPDGEPASAGGDKSENPADSPSAPKDQPKTPAPNPPVPAPPTAPAKSPTASCSPPRPTAPRPTPTPPISNTPAGKPISCSKRSPSK